MPLIIIILLLIFALWQLLSGVNWRAFARKNNNTAPHNFSVLDLQTPDTFFSKSLPKKIRNARALKSAKALLSSKPRAMHQKKHHFKGFFWHYDIAMPPYPFFHHFNISAVAIQQTGEETTLLGHCREQEIYRFFPAGVHTKLQKCADEIRFTKTYPYTCVVYPNGLLDVDPKGKPYQVFYSGKYNGAHYFGEWHILREDGTRASGAWIMSPVEVKSGKFW